MQCCSQGPNVRDQDQDQGLHVRDQDQDQGLHVQDQDQPVRDQELQHPRPRPRTKDFRAFALVSRIPIISDTLCQNFVLPLRSQNLHFAVCFSCFPLATGKSL